MSSILESYTRASYLSLYILMMKNKKKIKVSFSQKVGAFSYGVLIKIGKRLLGRKENPEGTDRDIRKYTGIKSKDSRKWQD